MPNKTFCNNFVKSKGFTILEITIVLGITAIFSVAGFFAFGSFQKSIAKIGFSEVENILIVTANKARNGLYGTSWGLYLPYNENTRKTNEIIIFSGNTYATRDSSKDINLKFNDSIRFADAFLSGNESSIGNDHEVVFSIYTGDTDDFGRINLESYGATSTILISKNGFITWE